MLSKIKGILRNIRDKVDFIKTSSDYSKTTILSNSTGCGK